MNALSAEILAEFVTLKVGNFLIEKIYETD
jgi:hypothetical protein